MKKKDVIEYFSGVANTAQVLKLSRQAIYQWPEDVPINQAWKISRLTGGKVAMRMKDYKMKALK